LFFTQALKRAVQTSPDGSSTIYGQRRRNWTATLDRIRRVASGLRAAGVSRGERVAILALNSDRYFELMYAIAWSGGVFVPMNTRWSLPELAYGLNDCQATVLCVDDEFVELAVAIQKQVPIGAIIYIGEGGTPLGMASYEQLVIDNVACEDAERSGNELCGIFYTGGTTGHPKGVMLSNANIIFASLNWLACLHVSSETIYMHVAGFFHLGGASPAFATTLAGGTNVILPKFVPRSAMQSIQEHRVNYTLLIPVMVNALINDSALAEYDLSSVRMCHYGGSPMPEAILKRIMVVLPTWTFHQGYGLTETSAVLTTLDWRQHALEGPLAKKLTSAGQVSPGWELKIGDERGRELARGRVGEIIVRGAGTMLGYWGKPDATSAIIRNGWLHTGDGAWMDDEGFIFIVDRVKDMIISGGENIYSTEVENAIYKHPAVRECAVIGIPDDVWGEKVHAVVVPHDGINLSADEVDSHCRQLIAGYKCPRSVEITKTPLPVSPTGKITKNVIREKFWAGKSRNVN
jgi:long-chain acyl-CoA synthetase